MSDAAFDLARYSLPKSIALMPSGATKPRKGRRALLRDANGRHSLQNCGIFANVRLPITRIVSREADNVGRIARL